MTEEMVFRSSIIAVSLLAHLPERTIVFGTPLWFGLAHVHHAWEVYRKNGSTRMAAKQAIGTSGDSPNIPPKHHEIAAFNPLHLPASDNSPAYSDCLSLRPQTPRSPR